MSVEGCWYCETHRDDNEVQPAPGVGKVLLEAICTLFDDHLQEEDDRKRLVHVLEHLLQRRPFLDMHVFNGLTTHTYFTMLRRIRRRIAAATVRGRDSDANELTKPKKNKPYIKNSKELQYKYCE